MVTTLLKQAKEAAWRIRQTPAWYEQHPEHHSIRDIGTLAEAFLEIVPADDDELVTLERVKAAAVGSFGEALMWVYDLGGGLSVTGIDDDPPDEWKWTLSTRKSQYADIPNPVTWGDVRRLCAVLRIELKEPCDEGAGEVAGGKN